MKKVIMKRGAIRVVPTRLRHAVAVVGAVLALCTSVRADFGAPALVTDGTGRATRCRLDLDAANNAYVVSIQGDRLLVDVIGANLRQRFDLPDGEVAQGGPAVINNSRGEAFVAIHQDDANSSEVGREILLASNGGGSFGNFSNLSLNAVDDFMPRMAIDVAGLPHIVWTQTEEDATEDDPTLVMYYNHKTSRRRLVGQGADPDVAMEAVTVDGQIQQVAHIVFVHENDIWYVNNSTGAFENAERVVSTPTEHESAPNIVINEQGDLFVTFIASDSLKFVSRRKGEKFSPQRSLDTNVGGEVEMKIRSGSLISIVYTKEGQIRYIQGLSTFLLEPETIELGEGTQSSPSLGADADGTLHLAYVENGEVYYTNNAEQIDADFTASPRTGEAPLTVKFQDLSGGRVRAWRWNFGEEPGVQSSARAPEYTFERPGKYDVTLTVFNADREATVVKEDYIIVQEPFNQLEIPDMDVVPNLQDVWFPVFATHRDPIRGFQVMATWDPGILTFDQCTLDFTATLSAAPEFFECNAVDGRVEVGCLIDFEPPFEVRAIPPGDRQTILHMVFDVSTRAPQGAATELRLVNDSSISRIFNIFTVDGFSKFPTLESSRIDIREVIPPPEFFLRGDSSGDGSVDITDALKLLNFLFRGGPRPVCMDAADFNDRGTVDISGAISVLNFLFLGGPAPMPPFPKTGIDPNPDGLPSCR